MAQKEDEKKPGSHFEPNVFGQYDAISGKRIDKVEVYDASVGKVVNSLVEEGE